MNGIKIVKTIQNVNDINIDNTYPIFSTFYTSDNGYEEYFLKLKKSLENFNLAYYAIDIIKGEKTWIEICSYKPDFLLMVLNKFPDRNIVWIDSDAIIEKEPALLKNINKDIGIHINKNFGVLSGTIFIKNSIIGKQILTDWIKETQKINNTKVNKLNNEIDFWDQKILEKVIKKNYMNNLFLLPKEYVSIFDHPEYKDLDWVISHWQSSRKLKYYNKYLKYKLKYLILKNKSS